MPKQIPKAWEKKMSKKIKGPFRIGCNNKSSIADFVVKNTESISDMMWQGLKFIMTQIKSDSLFGYESQTHITLRKMYLTQVLEKGFYNFYRMVNYNDKEARILTANAMKIWKTNANASISDINMKLLAENMYLAEATIAKEQKK